VSLCEKRQAAELARCIGLAALADDPNFYVLAIYYSNLREGGDGELLVKLLNGKMSIKGATYLKKVLPP